MRGFGRRIGERMGLYISAGLGAGAGAVTNRTPGIHRNLPMSPKQRLEMQPIPSRFELSFSISFASRVVKSFAGLRLLDIVSMNSAKALQCRHGLKVRFRARVGARGGDYR